jgi:hypothetical protein
MSWGEGGGLILFKSPMSLLTTGSLVVVENYDCPPLSQNDGSGLGLSIDSGDPMTNRVVKAR